VQINNKTNIKKEKHEIEQNKNEILLK